MVTTHRKAAVLAAVAATVGWFGGARELYLVAGLLVLVKGLAIPRLLGRMERRFGTERAHVHHLPRTGVRN